MANDFTIDRENSGMIFDNSEYKQNYDGKADPDSIPDYTGQVNVEGNQLRIALWYKDFKNGEGFSVKFSELDNGGGGGNSNNNSRSSSRNQDREYSGNNSNSRRSGGGKPSRR